MNRLNVKIEQSKEKITPFGGLVVFADLLKFLDIESRLNNILPKPNSNCGLLSSTKIIPSIISMVCGGRGFSDIDKIGKDKVIKTIFDISRIPDSSTINRFYNRYGDSKGDIATSKSITELGNLSIEIAIKGLRKQKVTEVCLDQDATYMKVYNVEAKKCYKGFKAYSSLTCFIDGCGYCIDEEFRNGNVSPSSGLLSQLVRVHKKLSSRNIKVSKLRNDSAAYQSDIFNYCIDNDIEFYIGAREDVSIGEAVYNIPSESWKRYHDKYGIKSPNEEISEFIHSMDKTKESFRVVVIRKKIESNQITIPELLGENYEYRFIATNSTLPAEEVVHFYNERGRCEYYIKEAKYGFDLKHLPSSELGGNGLWFKTGILAYNLIMYLKNIILGGSYTNKEIKSIRYLLFNIAGKLIYHSRRVILKLCCSDEMFRQIEIWRLRCSEQ